jgi:hypothetical protein
MKAGYLAFAAAAGLAIWLFNAHSEYRAHSGYREYRLTGTRDIRNVITQKPATPEILPKPAQPAFTRDRLSEEAAALNSLDHDPAGTLGRLNEIAQALSPGDRLALLDTVMDPAGGQNERMLAMHLLILSPATPTSVFIRVAELDDPTFHIAIPSHSENEFPYMLANALAVSALDVIQSRSLKDPGLLGELRRIADHTGSRVVRKVAHSMVKAVEHGKQYVAEVK